ncbi:MAG TPA: anti-sigma factor [Hyphomicrobiaceae bacterium]|nr:anti-sigma factor [Hyphomicrobiaceae bacterium]
MTPERRISEAELHAYLDGELTSDERAELEGLLAASPADAALLRDFARLNEAIGQRYAGVLDEPLPGELEQRLARIPEREGGRVSGALRPWTLIAAALAVAMLAGTAGFVARDLMIAKQRPEAGFVSTAIGAHRVYVPEVRHPVEVGASEETHLVQWLTKRIGAKVRAPALAGLGWKLVGGRLLPDDGQPAAQFMYEDGTGRRLTLYMRKETGLNNTAFQFAESEGFAAFYWVDRPLAYAIAGRLSREELTTIATAVYGQLEQR